MGRRRGATSVAKNEDHNESPEPEETPENADDDKNEDDQDSKRSLRVRKPAQLNMYDGRNHRWSDEEKIKLIKGLRRHGYKFKDIAEEIPSRSPLEVLYCLKYWKRIACIESIKSAKTAKYRLKRKVIPTKKRSITAQITFDNLTSIEAWIDCFSKQLTSSKTSDSEGVYALSNLFLTIATLEAHPDPDDADGLDFRELYLWIHNLLNGQPMRKLSYNMMRFIVDTFQEVIGATRGSGMISQLTYANHIASNGNYENVKPTKIKTYARPSKEESISDDYKTITEQLINLPHLNPLKIQLDERLKKSFDMSTMKQL